MEIYHGSQIILKEPIYNGSKARNDYGKGFYTTQEKELAKEWASSKNSPGYVNIYDLDINSLNILNLNNDQYNILNWLAILTKHRTYWQSHSIGEKAKDYLQDNFYIDVNKYDIIIGYRADDSYFSFAQDFINNVISLRKLSRAMKLGKLGEQLVLKSEKAFKQIKFIDSEIVDYQKYYLLKVERDQQARYDYFFSKQEEDNLEDIYMLDILREEIKNGDPRLQ